MFAFLVFLWTSYSLPLSIFLLELVIIALNILDVNLLFTLDLINIFSYSVCILMNFILCFVEENPYFSHNPILQYFPLYFGILEFHFPLYFGILFKRAFLVSSSQRYYPVFSSMNRLPLPFTFKSLIHL